MSSKTFSSSNIMRKVEMNRKKILKESRNKKGDSSSSSISLTTSNYSKETDQRMYTKNAVPKAKQTKIWWKDTSASAEKHKSRLGAGSFSAFNSKDSFKSDKYDENRARIKEWLNRITSSKEQLQNNQSGYKRISKYLQMDTEFGINSSVSQTSSGFYTNVIRVPTDRKLTQRFKAINSSEKLKMQKEALSPPSSDELSKRSSTKTVPNIDIEPKQSQEGKKQKEERNKVPLPKYEPFLPVRSDQKKLSSKLFLSSLLPPGEKELANLRKWKLKKSKQF